MRLHELKAFLDSASQADREDLAKLVQCGFGSASHILCDHFQWALCGGLGQLFYDGDYKDLVTAVADHEQIDWPSLLQERTWQQLTSVEIEDAIVVTVTRRIYNELPEGKQKEIAKELGKTVAKKDFSALLVSGSLMSVAKLSGFGVFKLASISVGAISGALGISIPVMGGYTVLSQAVALMIGPIGWAALAIPFLIGINKNNLPQLIAGVIYVSYLRHKRAFDSLPISAR